MAFVIVDIGRVLRDYPWFSAVDIDACSRLCHLRRQIPHSIRKQYFSRVEMHLGHWLPWDE
jgi:hypothetical protein